MAHCEMESQLEAALATHNTKFERAIVMDSKQGRLETSLQITTVRIDRKKRTGPFAVFPSFCPFCGEKIVVVEGASELI